MPDLTSLGLFAVATLALLIVPGPAVLYIVARGVDQGRAAALVSVAGIHVGTLVHVIAATVGLSAILAASATAFTSVKLIGAAYLVYLGIKRLRTPDSTEVAGDGGRVISLRRTFWQGAIVNILNPKTAIFFLAFLPQFANTDRPLAPQLALLGMMFLLLGACTDGLYALASGTVGRLLRTRPWAPKVTRYVTGGTYIALGVGTAAVGGARK